MPGSNNVRREQCCVPGTHTGAQEHEQKQGRESPPGPGVNKGSSRELQHLHLRLLIALGIEGVDGPGLLVDDAIVVLESIHREVEAGLDLNEAASTGTRKVATAVIASTLCVMAVFLPISFTTGLVGVFFYQYGVTIAVAVKK